MATAPAAQQNPDVQWALEDIRGRLPALKRRRDYIAGRHNPVVFEDRTISATLQPLLADLSDNLCDDVVEEPASRLHITAWRSVGVEAGTDQADAIGESAQTIWDLNRGDAREGMIYRDAWGLGDAFAIAERDAKGRARWYPQMPEQMAVRYSETDPDTVVVAAKCWPVKGRWRLNLYYGPDAEGGARLERFATRGSSPDGGIPQARAFLRMEAVEREDGSLDDGSREWTRNPVFHFPADAVGSYGRSVITDVIPLQDLLNKSIADLVVNMEDLALPQRYGTGITADLDEEGRPKPLKRRTRRASEMFTTASTDAAFGQFDGADLTQFLSVQQAWRLEIARKGYLPLFSIDTEGGASVASGLSLLVQEGRLVKRCKNGQRDFGWVFRELMAYLLTLQGMATEPDEVTMEWAPLPTRDEQALWETLTLKRDLGVPLEQILIEGGYAPGEVSDWLEEDAANEGGRVSLAGPGIASVTLPGVSGGLSLPAAPVQPAGAAAPAPVG